MKHPVFLFLLLLIATVQTSHGQKRQGYIDYDRIVSAFPDHIKSGEAIKHRTKELEDSLRVLGQSLQKLFEYHFPQHLSADSVIRKKLTNKFDSLQIKVELFERKAKREIAMLELNVKQNLRSLFTKEVNQFSVEQNVICVVDKKMVLYCDSCIDFTNEFILYYINKTFR